MKGHTGSVPGRDEDRSGCCLMYADDVIEVRSQSDNKSESLGVDIHDSLYCTSVTSSTYIKQRTQWPWSPLGRLSGFPPICTCTQNIGRQDPL